MSAINVTQMSKPVRGGVGYMATCGSCNRRNRLSQHQAKYYVSPEAKGWVWAMICKCGETCVVDVSAQHPLHSDAACTCPKSDTGSILYYSNSCPVPNHAAQVS